MFLSRFGLAGLGIKNAVMLSDVEAAVTSQAGVLDLLFWSCRLSKAGLLGRPARATAEAGQPTGSISSEGRSGIRPLSGLDAGFAAFAMSPYAAEATLRQADFKAIG
jgi:hypothetical protein